MTPKTIETLSDRVSGGKIKLRLNFTEPKASPQKCSIYCYIYLANLLGLQKCGQRYTNCIKLMKSSKTVQTIKVGDKVTFNNTKIEIFKAETSSDDKAVRQYQQLVLGGINQIGVVTELGGNLTTVSYPDGWDLPVPTKFLIVLAADK